MSNISSVGGSSSGAVPEGVGAAAALPPAGKAAASRVASAAPTPTPSDHEVHAAVSNIQSKVAAISPELQFTLDQTSGRSLIVVTDQSTREVLWQFPSEAAIEISKALDIFQKGALLTRKA